MEVPRGNPGGGDGKSPAGTVGIFVADDHDVVRTGIRALVESRPGWRICGEASTGPDAEREAIASGADLVLLDLAMPGANGLEAARSILAAKPETKILLFTMHQSEELFREAEEVGVAGYVLKSRAGSELSHAIEEVLAGGRWFPSLPFAEARGAASRLTPRERQVVRLIAEGQSTKELAASLGISVKTADTHRLNAMRKLGVHSVSEVVRYAIRNRLIDP
jgi:DNA-binding NarL/FixJ family response regulator